MKVSTGKFIADILDLPERRPCQRASQNRPLDRRRWATALQATVIQSRVLQEILQLRATRGGLDPVMNEFRVQQQNIPFLRHIKAGGNHLHDWLTWGRQLKQKRGLLELALSPFAKQENQPWFVCPLFQRLSQRSAKSAKTFQSSAFIECLPVRTW
jgi:hypothetical protein